MDGRYLPFFSHILPFLPSVFSTYPSVFCMFYLPFFRNTFRFHSKKIPSVSNYPLIMIFVWESGLKGFDNIFFQSAVNAQWSFPNPCITTHKWKVILRQVKFLLKHWFFTVSICFFPSPKSCDLLIMPKITCKQIYMVTNLGILKFLRWTFWGFYPPLLEISLVGCSEHQ